MKTYNFKPAVLYYPGAEVTLTMSELLAAGKLFSDAVAAQTDQPLIGELPNTGGTNMVSKFLEGGWNKAKDTWNGMSTESKVIAGTLATAALALPVAKALRTRSGRTVVNVDADNDEDVGGDGSGQDISRDDAKMLLVTQAASGANGNLSHSFPLSSMLPDDVILSTLALGRAHKSAGRFSEWLAEPEVAMGDPASIIDGRVPAYGVNSDGSVVHGFDYTQSDAPMMGGFFKKIAKAAGKGLKLASKSVKLLKPITGLASKLNIPVISTAAALANKGLDLADKAGLSKLVDKATNLASGALSSIGSSRKRGPSTSIVNVENEPVLPNQNSSYVQSIQAELPHQAPYGMVRGLPNSHFSSPYRVPNDPNYSEQGMDVLQRAESRDSRIQTSLAQNEVPSVPTPDYNQALRRVSMPIRFQQSRAEDYV